MGTDLDHEYRYRDHMKTSQGMAMKQLMNLVCVWRSIGAGVEKEKLVREEKRLKRGLKAEDEKQVPEKHVVANQYLPQLEAFLERSVDSTGSKYALQQRMKKLEEKKYVEEMRYAKKFGTRGEWKQADEASHQMLLELLRERLLSSLKIELQEKDKKRLEEVTKLEAETAGRFGSRVSGWELVLDVQSDKMVYVCKDTKEEQPLQLRHCKTAFCERCDEIYVQDEMFCGQCEFPRSDHNLQFFRQLGSKDITLEA